MVTLLVAHHFVVADSGHMIVRFNKLIYDQRQQEKALLDYKDITLCPLESPKPRSDPVDDLKVVSSLTETPHLLHLLSCRWHEPLSRYFSYSRALPTS